MTPPNILLVVTDQQRPDLVGALGQVPVKTPAADQLMAEGTAFTHAYTPCPLCTPARASLLTGQYPSRHGAWSIGTDTPDDALSLPQLLAEGAGYRTGIVGKSHLKSCHTLGSFEALPHVRDWDFFADWSGPWFGFEHARISVGHGCEPHAYGMHYGLWLRERGIPPEPPYFDRERGDGVDDGSGRWALPEEFHSSRWVADETIAYLQNHRHEHSDQPFYLSVNFPDPHAPFVVPEPWHAIYDDVTLPPSVRRMGEWQDKPTLYRATVEGRLPDLGWHEHARLPAQFSKGATSEARDTREEREWRTYLGMQSLLDHHLGRILNALGDLELAEDTLVVFTSDHGDAMGDHFLRAKGGSHYDAAARVPFVVRWPGRVPAGTRSAALQSLVDLPTTFMRAAGLEKHPEMQGVDQLPSWQDPSLQVRAGVLIDHRVERGLYVNSWITDRYRLSVHSIHAEDRDEIELYDFETDPHEFVNLAAGGAHPELVNSLMAELLRYRMKVAGPWSERPTFA